MVPSGDDIQMVVYGPAPGLHDGLVLQQMDFGLGVVLLEPIQEVLGAEVEFMDFVGHVEVVGHALELHLHEVVEVGVATHVEVARDLLDREGPHQPAAVLPFEGLSHRLDLAHRALLVQQLERPLV